MDRGLINIFIKAVFHAETLFVSAWNSKELAMASSHVLRIWKGVGKCKEQALDGYPGVVTLS